MSALRKTVGQTVHPAKGVQSDGWKSGGAVGITCQTPGTMSYENNYLNTKNEAIMLCKRNEIKSEEKKSILHNSCYWICNMHGRSYIWKPIGISANL